METAGWPLSHRFSEKELLSWCPVPVLGVDKLRLYLCLRVIVGAASCGLQNKGLVSGTQLAASRGSEANTPYAVC